MTSSIPFLVSSRKFSVYKEASEPLFPEPNIYDGKWHKHDGVQNPFLTPHERVEVILAKSNGVPEDDYARRSEDWIWNNSAIHDKRYCITHFRVRP